MRTVLDFSNLPQHIDSVITKEFISTITGNVKYSENERRLLPLLPKFGGLGIPIVSGASDFEYSNSKMVTKQLWQKTLR